MCNCKHSTGCQGSIVIQYLSYTAVAHFKVLLKADLLKKKKKKELDPYMVVCPQPKDLSTFLTTASNNHIFCHCKLTFSPK